MSSYEDDDEEIPMDFVERRREPRFAHVHVMNGHTKLIAWIAGVGATLITASIIAGTTVLWNMSKDVAVLKSQIEYLVHDSRKVP